MKTAFKFAVDSRPRDERGFRSHAGASRFAWNWALAKCKERYEAEKKANPDLAWCPATPSAPTRRRSGTSTGP